MAIMLAFDCSNWTGEITLEQAAEAHKTYSRAVVQIIDPPRAYPASAWRNQVAVCAAVGMDVEAYTYLYLRSDPAGRVRWVLEQLGMCPGVKRLWLDVEDEGDSEITLEERQSALRLAVETAQKAGYEVGLYTAAWWWDQYMPGVTEFKYLPLWAAYWDQAQDLGFKEFGGWSYAAMKQFAGESAVGDISHVDLSYYDR